ncbi:hypothetical protein [Aureispira sp. CCB-E]|uniref:hypothetical protein n=1 Tax=Aureispira sp. CCB-E TaxID=3051121 RepID=UPI0028684061|nr:hypothetical protein [Aureispira sp. CCB-E]WMX17578.1 hypothetical protein QP953_28580 [Aureispira sp. CCB-E]
MQGIKYFILFMILVGCGNRDLIPSDYVAWVNDSNNGLLKKKSIHPLEVELLYKPIPYIIANEQRSNTIDEGIYQKRMKDLKELQYYTLKLGILGGEFNVSNYEVSDNATQQERLNYLSFAMQKDIKLVEGKDTLNCALYHFERSYDITPYRTFVLAFQQKEINKGKDKTLILDLAYFKTGPIKLNFKGADLVRIPNLKL